jgi:hypothetical protein
MRRKSSTLLRFFSLISVVAIATVSYGGGASAQAEHRSPRARPLVGTDRISGVVDSPEVTLTGGGHLRHFGRTTSVLHSSLPDGSDQTVDVTTNKGVIHQVPAGDLDASDVTCPTTQFAGKAAYEIRGGTGIFEHATGSVVVRTCALVEPLSATSFRVTIDVKVFGTIIY